MPRIINNFNAVIATKSYLEYIVQDNSIVVCNFPALDTLHDLGYAKKYQHSKDLFLAVRDSRLIYAKFSISSPDSLKVVVPLTALKSRDRLRDTIIWFVRHITKNLLVNTHIIFIRNDGKEVKLNVSNAEFFRIAIDGVT
jgi:hypothetical protein